MAVSDKILFTEKTCRNGAEEPALNFRSAPESDRLLRCRELTLWATFRRTHPQQNSLPFRRRITKLATDLPMGR